MWVVSLKKEKRAQGRREDETESEAVEMAALLAVLDLSELDMLSGWNGR